VTLLRVWMLATTALVSAMAIWVYAPVLFFVVLLTAVLGLASAIMIAFARWLQARRERGGARDEGGNER
jgi:preprotein translocase subunit SecF